MIEPSRQKKVGAKINLLANRYRCRPLFRLLLATVLLCCAGGLALAGDPAAKKPEDVITDAFTKHLPVSAKPFSFLGPVGISPDLTDRHMLLGDRSATSLPYGKTIAVDPVEGRSFYDKSKSYLFAFENGTGNDPMVGLAKIQRVETSQSGRLAPGEYRAEFMIGYNVASLGSILFGRGMQLERPGDTTLKLQDDGWRFRLIKRF
ncbi:MAG: hypothetical protein A4E57_00211 [Syntrophorhabdaceae bacterium PtaU1.Bin034]|jgi:hypothetical protein|nr:MAG: hypothetical protein A4E57_00211 [Syntrophorhabdaceae bacterium PtaU1.Bin034]